MAYTQKTLPLPCNCKYC